MADFDRAREKDRERERERDSERERERERQRKRERESFIAYVICDLMLYACQNAKGTAICFKI